MKIKNEKLKVKNIVLLLAFNFAFLISSAAAQSFPKAAGRINDFADIIDAATEADLDRKIDQLEQKTTSEIAVATVSSLDGMEVEEYANKLFKAWGVGQAKQDNGVLVLVAPTERKMRIEVGYGLEGVLPDGLAGEVIRQQFTPKFEANDYSGGINDGVTRLVEIVEKHEVLSADEIERINSGRTRLSIPARIGILLFFAVFVSVGFGMAGIGVRTKTGFPLLFGGFFGTLPLGMSLVFMKYLSLFTLFPLAAAAATIGFRMGGKQSVRDAWRSGAAASSTGWTMGDNDSDSSSSSSSSSSDYGGGSSGGGGASGSW